MIKKNIIIFSSIDWGTHRQLHHELVDNLIDSGNKILFIENTGSRSFKLKDIFRVKKRVSDWLKSNNGYYNLNSDLTIYSPIFIPLNFFKPIVSLNSFFLANSIIKWLKITYFGSPIVISFLPSPLVQKIINKIDPKLKIYYCADLMFKPNKSSKKIKKWEIKFIKSVDHIFYTSIKLGQYIEKYSNKKNYSYIPNGVNFSRFRKFNKIDLNKEIQNNKIPIIGYVGAIRSILDYELIEFLLKNIKANFLFIGPVLEKKYLKLSKYKNCIFLGTKKHELIPGYIENFNACIIPYVKNDFTDAIYPVKLNEYLILGKRVVTTNILELKEFNNKNQIIDVCDSKEQFKNKIKSIISNPDIDISYKDKIISIANDNSWDARFDQLKNTINNYLKINNEAVTDNWTVFINKYKFNLLKSITKKISLILFIYFFIFISPFYWYLGEHLTVRNIESKNDIAVVLSGTNAKNFIDKNYQNRVNKAIDLYKNNFVDKIYISSGYVQNEIGVSFIKNYLKSRNIPINIYYIEDKLSKTTYDNLLNIYSFLKKNKINSIILFTDNYHSKRVELIWNSKFSDISKIIIIDEYQKKIKWNIGFDKIKNINYEYLAIIHNFILNRI